MIEISTELLDEPPLSYADMLGHLRPVDQYSVRLMSTEQRGAATMRRYLVSATTYQGTDVALSLHLCILDPENRSVALSVPGGRGAFDEDTLWWLAGRFAANYAAVDWIGRGRSPSHPHLRCDYDPIYMPEDDVRQAYLFHNLAAIWACLNWLFYIGYLPTDVIGGSWGGVFCYLMAALEPRVRRIFPTFGCGGMSFERIEKRSMWDAAIEQMGPHRTLAWRRAFDPLLRMNEIDADLYYETATNDKFFSIDMAMSTWRRARRPCFLSLVANQDHSMNPNGAQQYVVQRFVNMGCLDSPELSGTTLRWDPVSAEVVATPPNGAPKADGLALYWSEQLNSHGNMSREWHLARPVRAGDDGVVFCLQPTNAAATLLYFMSGEISAGNVAIRASTPLHLADAAEPMPGVARPASRASLLSTEGVDPWTAPIGDKSSPTITLIDAGWLVRFGGLPLSRVTRFGLRPWLMPSGWRSIELVLADPIAPQAAGLDLFLSRRYQRNDEEAVVQSFADAVASTDGRRHKLRFQRELFRPAVVVEERFRRHEPPDVAAILDDFDSVGIIDRYGRFTGEIVLSAISIDSDLTRAAALVGPDR